jgi:hypothetical protein
MGFVLSGRSIQVWTIVGQWLAEASLKVSPRLPTPPAPVGSKSKLANERQRELVCMVVVPLRSTLFVAIYGWTYQHSAHRTQALASWQHHYNRRRPHVQAQILSAKPLDGSHLGSC